MGSLLSLHTLLLDLLFPRCCVICGKEGGWTCEQCSQKEIGQIKAPQILDLEGRVISLLPFEVSIVRELLHNLKYNSIYEAADTLIQLAITSYTANAVRTALQLSGEAALVPIPVSPTRLKSRGYNQVDKLAEPLSRWLGIPVFNKVLERNDKAGSQVGKSIEERSKAGKKFSWNKEILLSNTEVILLDDVLTTGATLQAAEVAFREISDRPLHKLVIAHKS